MEPLLLLLQDPSRHCFTPVPILYKPYERCYLFTTFSLTRPFPLRPKIPLSLLFKLTPRFTDNAYDPRVFCLGNQHPHRLATGASPRSPGAPLAIRYAHCVNGSARLIESLKNIDILLCFSYEDANNTADERH